MKNENAIGLRVTPELYKELQDVCGKLDGMPINGFALKAVESALEMIKQPKPTLPKWISVCRYSLNFDKGEKF